MSNNNISKLEENYQKSNSNRKEIMILAIELGDNEKKYLKIFNDTYPEKLAYEFCLQNNLDFNSLQELTEEIKNALNNNNSKNYNDSSQNNINNKIINQNQKPNNNINNSFKKNNKKNDIKQKTIDALTELLSTTKNEKGYLNKPKIKKNNILLEQNNNYKNVSNNKNKHYFSHTTSSLSKKRFSNSEMSMCTNENINNKSNNSYNIIKGLNNKILNNNKNYFEKEIELSYSQSHNNSKMNYLKKKNSNKEFNSNDNLNNENKQNKGNNKNKEEDYILNYGERLYHKGLKLQEKTNDRIEKLRTEKDTKNKKIYTFKPKINNISYSALTNRYNNKLSYNDEDNILNYKEYLDNKLEYLKEKYDNKKEYNFTPRINKKSIRIDRNKNFNNNNFKSPRYEKLYLNYKKKEIKLNNLSNKIYDKNKLFKPKINNYNSDLINLKFSERQNAYKSKSIEKKKKFKI